MKPYSESCDQNRDAILKVIQPLLEKARSILEVGSGTGQHAVFMAAEMPHLQWHTSDRREHHPGISQWLAEAGLDNLHAPLELDVLCDSWPDREFDAVFSANTVHIMHWQDVEAFIAGVGQVLQSEGLFLLYGPFNYNGQFTSESNARFDLWLKERDSQSGVRDFESLNRLAMDAGLELMQDVAMPANNRILCWRKCR